MNSNANSMTNNTTMNTAVRKIHNLLNSGAVTVTGPNQPRILKQKVTSNSNPNRCYICDENITPSVGQHHLNDMHTSHTSTNFPKKIAQLVGEAYMVIVSHEDVVCSRCTNLINYLDRLENDVDRVRSNLMNLLHKKYGLNDEGGGGLANSSPPTKMQKLNSGAIRTIEDTTDMTRTRKLVATGTDSGIVKQSPAVSAVQQIKIPTHASPQTQATAGTQTVQRKTTKIYKCLTCDYKTSDMRLFNTHYETCKHQNFQCKNCKKIFPNFGAMKTHMVREHNTPMDNTCSVCHINFVNEVALRKHMELNHSTNVLVTSTTTLPATSADASVLGQVPIYTCNHCQYKTTDKVAFEDHMHKHVSPTGNSVNTVNTVNAISKPKPFKCRLCAQRFETREAATIHAKQHQPNYFKCGTCSMSFPKRELLVKHFEVHQVPTPTATSAVTVHQQVQQTAATPTTTTVVSKQTPAATTQTHMTTQKLLQETIDEALSESGSNSATAAADITADGNIRFYSCNLCSLTFLQENYYLTHMKTHQPDKKGSPTLTTGDKAELTNTIAAISSAASVSLLSGDGISTAGTKSSSKIGAATQQSSNINASISEADIESIFEKIHSEKGESSVDTVSTSAPNTTTTNTTSTTSGDNLVITSQEGSGGITFNITIPQPDTDASEEAGETSKTPSTTATPVSVGIDMPMLDQPDDATPSSTSGKKEKADSTETEVKNGTSKKSTGPPVSMPSLDDDNDAQLEQASSTQDGSTAETDESKNTEELSSNEKDENESSKTDAKETVASGETPTADTPTLDSADGEQNNVSGADSAESAEQLEGATAGDQHVAMELDEAMQAQVEGGQIKFILNENGHLLQLDNHIITDADGNQILVQDPEQIQQLLQSCVLQSGDGLDGETIQMMTDGNGQMVLVQGENNETQLIDASLLNTEGQLVIQQGQDGELGDSGHVIGTDGTRIPVSVSYTADGQPIVQVQQQVLEGSDGTHVVIDKDAAVTADSEAAQQAVDAAGGGNASGGGFFALEDLMQQSSESGKAAE